MNYLNEDYKQIKWIILAFFLHLVAAIFGVGYAYPDEHFQILEFANFKLGNIPASSLPWEFHEQMRPWAQPFISYLIVIFLKFFGIESPFAWTLVMRLISAFWGVCSIVLLYRASSGWFKSPKVSGLVLKVLTLAWFLPYLHARHTSENWSATFFIIGMSYLLIKLDQIKEMQRGSWIKAILIGGAAIGASFLFRYQIGFMILGFLVWIVLVGKAPLKFLTYLILFMAFIVLGVGSVVDFWGYGELALPPWNYFIQNIIKGKAAQFSVSPWWYYFKEALTYKAPPFGIIVALAFLLGWIRFPRNVLTWTTVPFVLIHFIVGHKELRFLYPAVALSPVYLVLLWSSHGHHFKKIRLGRFVEKGVIALNCLFLVISVFRPAKSAVNFYQHLYNKSERIESIVALGKYNPFDICGPMVARFYLGSIPRVVFVSDAKMIGGREKSPPRWIFTDKLDQARQIRQKHPGCRVDFGHLPEWVDSSGLVDRFYKKGRIWTLLKCG